jgi:hypothetical protein|tara:strand:+ start:371 stop:940 length:570 start_codon:yes stop_codon:yes gene_type:complete
MKTLNGFLETTKYRWIRKQYIEACKYINALEHIVEHKPKFIVEYGAGQSTLMITELVNYLDYGGKVIAYESEEKFYNQHIERGWNKYNNIHLVEIEEEHHEFLPNKIIPGVTYIHPMEDIQGVDFVIIDGPDLQTFTSKPDTTFNLKEIVDYLGYEIPFFIDGRRGTIIYYDKLGYKKNIGDKKNANNS